MYAQSNLKKPRKANLKKPSKEIRTSTAANILANCTKVSVCVDLRRISPGANIRDVSQAGVAQIRASTLRHCITLGVIPL